MIVQFGQQVMDSQEELKVLAQKNTLKALSLLRQYGLTPLCLYGTAYRRPYGSFTAGVFNKSLCSPSALSSGPWRTRPLFLRERQQVTIPLPQPLFVLHVKARNLLSRCGSRVRCVVWVGGRLPLS